MSVNEKSQLERILVQMRENAPNNQTFESWFLAQFITNTCALEDFTIFFLHALRQVTQRHLKRVKIEYEPKSTPSAVSSTSWKKLTNVKRLSLTSGNQNSNKKSSYKSCFDSTNFDSDFPQSLNSSSPLSSSRTTQRQQQQTPSKFGSKCSTPVSSRRNSSRLESNLSLSDFISFPTTSPLNGNRLKKKHNRNSNASLNNGNISSNSNGSRKNVHTMSPSQSISTHSSPSSSPESNNNSFDVAEIVDTKKMPIDAMASRMQRPAENSPNTSFKVLNTPPRGSNTSRIDTLDEGRIQIASIQPVDLSKIVEKAALNHIAQIYACLCDINLVPNILREIGYVLKLLNGQLNEPNGDEQVDTIDSPLSLLADFSNCIYFARDMLVREQEIVCALDSQSLSVVLNNDRFDLLPQDLKYKLEMCHQYKTTIGKHLSVTLEETNNFNNVYYRPEENTREMFDNEMMFCAFKKQRDLFYSACNEWESNHIFNRDFSFKHSLAPIVHEIFEVSKHTLNMFYLAQLFVAQLLIEQTPDVTCNEVDSKKQKLLEQRFFTPGEYCMDMDYCFPDKQIFFRDFINECGSLSFLEQLKLVLFEELMKLNRSSFQQLSFDSSTASVADRLDQEDMQRSPERSRTYVTNPEILKSMLKLAKFLGYVKGLPYGASNSDEILQQGSAVSHQLRLRAMLQTDFDIYAIVKADIKSGKILLTLPWLIQYLAMLDNITLQLDSCSSVLNLLFEIHIYLGNERPSLLPAVAFILRCCIGWLIELKPTISSRYYKYRRAEILIPDELQLEQRQLIRSSIASLEISKLPKNSIKECPQLEQLLTVICPFLPEFRVTIMPVRHTYAKCPSRSGLFRHRTVNLTKKDQITKVLSPSQQQQKISDAFLYSQGTSMRNFFEMVSERTYKSVIKDAKIEVLQPSKFAANRKVNALDDELCEAKMLAAVDEIYSEAEREACITWQRRVPIMIEERVTKAINALLPASTSAIIKRTYYQLIKSKVSLQVQQWLNETVLETDYYRANTDNNNALHIVPNGVSISDLITDIIHWQHTTSMCPQNARSQIELIDFLERLLLSFEHTLPSHYYEQFGIGLVNLAQNLALSLPNMLTPKAIELICRNLLKIIDAGGLRRSKRFKQTHFLDIIFKVPYIMQLMSAKNPLAFKAYEQLVISLIKSSVLTIDVVNTLLMPLLKEDWEQNALEKLSHMTRNIAQETKAESSQTDDKEHLIMEVLSDIMKDTAF